MYTNKRIKRTEKMLFVILFAYIKVTLSASVVSVDLSAYPTDVTYMHGKTSIDLAAGSEGIERNAKLITKADDFELKSQSPSANSTSSISYTHTFDRYIQPLNVPPTIQTIYSSSNFSPLKQGSSNLEFESMNNVQTPNYQGAQYHEKLLNFQEQSDQPFVIGQRKSIVIQNQPYVSHQQSSTQSSHEKLIRTEIPEHSHIIHHQSEPQSITFHSTTPASSVQTASKNNPASTVYLNSALNYNSEGSHFSFDPDSSRAVSTTVNSYHTPAIHSISTPASAPLVHSTKSISSIPTPTHHQVFQQSPTIQQSSISNTHLDRTISAIHPQPAIIPQSDPIVTFYSAQSPVSTNIITEFPDAPVSIHPVSIIPPKPLIPVSTPISVPVTGLPPKRFVSVSRPMSVVQTIPGVVEKTLNVAQPLLKTKTYMVRRPGVQKQFYDIEERVIIRPAGSFVVELDGPVSKIPKDETYYPLGYPQITHAHQQYAANAYQKNSGTIVEQGGRISDALTSVQNQHLTHRDHVVQDFHSDTSTTPSITAPIVSTTTLSSTSTDDYSAIIEAARLKQANDAIHHINVDEKYTQSNSSLDSTAFNRYLEEQHNVQLQKEYNLSQQTHPSFQGNDNTAQSRPTPFMLAVGEPDFRYPPYVESKSNGEPQKNSKITTHSYESTFTTENMPVLRGDISQPVGREHSLKPSYTSSFYGSSTSYNPSQYYNDNQDKYLRLVLSNQDAREVLNSNSNSLQGNSFRSRVIATSPSGKDGVPLGEQVYARRIVVSQPVETIQEVREHIPLTNIQQVTANQPTVYKTTSVTLKPLQTTIPVQGKPLRPIIQAHPDYSTYHPISVSY